MKGLPLSYLFLSECILFGTLNMCCISVFYLFRNHAKGNTLSGLQVVRLLDQTERGFSIVYKTVENNMLCFHNYELRNPMKGKQKVTQRMTLSCVCFAKTMDENNIPASVSRLLCCSPRAHNALE